MTNTTKRLFDIFNEKFEQNIRPGHPLLDAFEKTNSDMGFTAYSSYQSFSVVRKRKKNKRSH